MVEKKNLRSVEFSDAEIHMHYGGAALKDKPHRLVGNLTLVSH